MRARELIERLHVLPDNATVKDIGNFNSEGETNYQFTQDKVLPIGGKVKERALKIFKFGDQIQALTVSANDGLVRAARQQVCIDR